MDLYQYDNMDSTKLSSSASRHNSTLKVKAEADTTMLFDGY